MGSLPGCEAARLIRAARPATVAFEIVDMPSGWPSAALMRRSCPQGPHRLGDRLTTLREW